MGLALVMSISLTGCTTVSNWFAEEEEIAIRTLKPIDAEFEPEVIWDTDVGDGIDDYFSRLRPVYGDNKVFAASRHGEVAALDPETGEKHWQRNLATFADDGMFSAVSQLWRSGESARIGGLAFNEQTVYVGTENGAIIAMDSATGETRWSHSVEGEILSAPVVSEGVLVVNTGAGTLFGIDADSGEQLWLNESDVPPLTLRGISAPIAANGGTIVGTPTGKIQVNIIDSGLVAWETAITKPAGATELERIVDVDVTPLMYGGIIYAISYNGTLAAIELRSGRVIWKREYGSYRDVTLSDNTLFVVDNKSIVYGLDRRNGVELWSQSSLKQRNLTEALPVGDHVVVGDKWGFLHWINQEDGKIVARYDLGGDDEDESVYVSPIVVDDKIVAITRDGTVAALTIGQ
ncbi:outer membrane protein assembly factor BamB [Alteromonas lipotrueiana]|uniref:outer membrane protein assembly factor BamB n=1 Tax=Alteromonas lipotrueiana TaxID=2803815 RepID=UPI003CCEA6B7